MSLKHNLICIVDDDRSMSRMLSRVIRASAFEVVSFGSAEEFLESNAVEESACLILDLNLPGMSGIDLQQHLTNSGSEMPIIFISGHADEATKRGVLEAGAAGFFNNPFKIDTLLEMVRGLPALVHRQSKPLLDCTKVQVKRTNVQF
jgi:FixJ family two-component response regulator